MQYLVFLSMCVLERRGITTKVVRGMMRANFVARNSWSHLAIDLDTISFTLALTLGISGLEVIEQAYQEWPRGLCRGSLKMVNDDVGSRASKE